MGMNVAVYAVFFVIFYVYRDIYVTYIANFHIERIKEQLIKRLTRFFVITHPDRNGTYIFGIEIRHWKYHPLLTFSLSLYLSLASDSLEMRNNELR